jgi:hypothetical protein
MKPLTYVRVVPAERPARGPMNARRAESPSVVRGRRESGRPISSGRSGEATVMASVMVARPESVQSATEVFKSTVPPVKRSSPAAPSI